jgi:hypothetical protein
MSTVGLPERIKQNLRTIPRATEKFITVIGPDNKAIYYADKDDIMDLKIINKDTL